MDIKYLLAKLLLLLFVFAAVIWDIRQRRIPNKLIFISVFLGCVLQLALAGAAGLLDPLAGLGVGLVVLLPGYLIGATGAGDVKLMAAIGTFLGPYDVFLAAMASIAMGSIIALGYAASSLFNQASVSPWPRYGLMFKTLVTTGRPIYIAPAEGEVMGRKFPFAVSIAIGTTLFLVWDSQLLTLAGLAK